MTSAARAPASLIENTIAVHAQGVVVRRNAKLWGRFKQLFGAAADTTQRVHTHLTAVHLVDGVKEVLAELGVTNAVRLEVDGIVLFEDREGRPDDLVDLFAAFDAQADEARELRSLLLTVEHTHADMHVVLTIDGRGEHERDEATVTVAVAAEIKPSATDPRAQLGEFDALLAQIRASLIDAMPDMRVSELVPTTLELPVAITAQPAAPADDVGGDFEWAPESLSPAADGEI